VVAEAQRMKDSYLALQRLSEMYESLSLPDRERADQVFGEWVLSEDEGIRFDAQALIRKFEIRTALPPLRELAERLMDSNDVSAPFEAEKVETLISELTADA